MTTRIENSNKSKFMEDIAMILGILEEKSLSKDWLLSELKRYKMKLHVSVASNSYQILRECNPKIIQRVLEGLKEDLVIRDVKTLTKTLHWFFIDIVSSSDPNLSVKSQARKINVLNELIKRTETFKGNTERLVILPTGDGMAIGFPDSPEKPLRLAIELHKSVKKFNRTQKEKGRVIIRIGIDTGPVYFMKGIRGEIFWGPGLILAKRVMDLCGPNQIFASGRIAKDLKSLSDENKATIHPIGEYEIKHGKIEIFNIFSKEFGNNIIPKKGKISKIKEDDFKKEPDFEFNNVEIHLDVIDHESMMTHHTWIWDVRNLSNNPLKAIFYNIGGDTPRDFSDLNVKVTDENNEILKILSVDVNKPHEKAFHVEVVPPFKKYQKNRQIKLEYDWEEPDRVFEYSFSAKAKKFKYVFTAPKELEIKNRILETVKDLGKKRRVEPPASIRYLKNKTEIIFETGKKHKIQTHDTFEFHW